MAGKPQRPLLDETVRRVGGERPLMVGDRLDTDIEGAHEAEVDSLLVLTGVTGLADLVAATPRLRPTYLVGGPGRPVRAARRAGAGRRRLGGRAAGSARWPTGGSRSTGDGDAGRLVARGRRRRPGSTSTAPARPADVDGLAAPRADAGERGR